MIEWAKKAPPKPREKHMGLSTAYVEFREALLAHPGRWAKYPVPLHSLKAIKDVAYCINTNRRPAFPSDQFEAREDDGALWMRAIPPKRKRKQ